MNDVSSSSSPDPHSGHHRRELVRAYKERVPPMGVYVVRNRANGRLLLGASLDTTAAWNRHRFELLRQQHRDPELREDWRTAGAEAFEFEVIEPLKPRDTPGFDARQELALLLELWRDELLRRGECLYGRGGVR